MKIEPGLFVFAATISGFSAELGPKISGPANRFAPPAPHSLPPAGIPARDDPAAYRKYIEQSYI
jgi:hypothetical protein